MKTSFLYLVATLVVGAVGGALGARLLPSAAPAPAAPPLDRRSEASDVDALRARLDALETRVADEDAPRSLTGRPAPAAPDLGPEAEARLLASLQPKIDEQVEAKVAEIVEREGLGKDKPEADATPRRPKVTLAEAAAEVGLTASQEAALREVYRRHEEQLLDIFTGEDGDRDALLADVETLKRDPSSRARIAQKYVPRVMKKLPELMAAEMSKQVALQEAVGPELAEKLGDFDIEESHPFGLTDGGFTVNASASVER